MLPNLMLREAGWGGATVLDLLTHVLLRCGTLVMTSNIFDATLERRGGDFKSLLANCAHFLQTATKTTGAFVKAASKKLQAEWYINLIRVILQDPHGLSVLHVQLMEFLFDRVPGGRVEKLAG